MSFLLDTNICSAHIVRPGGLAHKFFQYLGRLYIPTIVLGELYVWAYRRPNPISLLQTIDDQLLADVQLFGFDKDCAHEFGCVRGTLLSRGITISATDMQIAAVALVHRHTLVTHNLAHFQHIPGLQLDDWLVP